MVSLTETVEQFAFAHKEMDRVHGELSTLRARIVELEQVVTKARDTFKHYGDLHAAKPDEVKAKRNYDLADEMQRALSSEREG